jgi:hypothetical protein
MKALVTVLVVLSVGVVGGTMVYLKQSKPDSAPGPAQPPPVEIRAHVPEPAAEVRTLPTVVPSATEPSRRTVEKVEKPESATREPASKLESLVPETPHARQVAVLIAPETGYKDRLNLLRELKKSGELKAVIAELQQRASANPNDAGIHVAIGEALIARFPVQDYNERAILGLQIDQSFDTALKLDPANWEAQYSKALALSAWPAEMNTGPQVIEQLSRLIDQQETMPAQSHFAKTYLLLGNQYRKAGQTDYAQATWRLGLAKFPNDAALRERIANP